MTRRVRYEVGDAWVVSREYVKTTYESRLSNGNLDYSKPTETTCIQHEIVAIVGEWKNKTARTLKVMTTPLESEGSYYRGKYGSLSLTNANVTRFLEYGVATKQRADYQAKSQKPAEYVSLFDENNPYRLEVVLYHKGPYKLLENMFEDLSASCEHEAKRAKRKLITAQERDLRARTHVDQIDEMREQLNKVLRQGERNGD